MLDDDDVDFTILVSNPTTWLGLLLLIAVVVVMVIVVHGNKDECAAKRCAAGQVGRLLDHECLCVGTPIDEARDAGADQARGER